MLAGQLQRVDFSSIFTYLGEKVLDLKVGDILRQTLEVVMQEITPTTFNVYSNETYPSIFNINTLSQVVYHTLGKLGEQPVFELTPSGAITASGVALAGSDVAQLYNNVECQVVINIPITTQGYELFNENMSILGVELGGQNVRLATPYNFENGVATFKNLRQVAHSQDAVNGITYTMKCFIKIGTGGDITFLVDEDNLDDYAEPVDETYTIASEMWRALSGNDPYKFMASVTAEYTISTKTEVGTINDQPALFANYGFVVGSVSNQTVIIFAVSKPTADVNLSVRFRG